MPNFEREKEILKILEKKYTVSVKELADTLYASEPTIRESNREHDFRRYKRCTISTGTTYV